MATSKKPKKEEPSKDYKVIAGFAIALVIIIAAIYLIAKIPIKQEPIIEIEQQEPIIKEYDGYTFNKKGDVWFSNIHVDDKVFELMMYYPPDETEDIKTEVGYQESFMNAGLIYITIDPTLTSEAVVAGTEVSKIIGRVFGKQVKATLTKEVLGSEVEKIDCENSSRIKPVIKFILGNETEIYLEQDYCLVVQGTSERELIRAADRIDYGFLKIMD